MTQTLADTLQRFKHHCKTCDFCHDACQSYTQPASSGGADGSLWLCNVGRNILMALLDVVFGD